MSEHKEGRTERMKTLSLYQLLDRFAPGKTCSKSAHFLFPLLYPFLPPRLTGLNRASQNRCGGSEWRYGRLTAALLGWSGVERGNLHFAKLNRRARAWAASNPSSANPNFSKLNQRGTCRYFVKIKTHPSGCGERVPRKVVCTDVKVTR